MSSSAAEQDFFQEDLLVQNAQAGDPQAFGELVRKYQRFVFNLALRSLGSVEEAQDAAQEAFLRAWRGLPRFQGKARFSTWLYRITANLCLNRRPRLRRELHEISIEESAETGLDLAEASGGPALQVEAGELRALLHAAVERLPESYRLLVILRYQQDLSYNEIAEVLGLQVGAVKTGLFRARNQLRTAITTRGEARWEETQCSNETGADKWLAQTQKTEKQTKSQTRCASCP
jgi:RNA polymerase sigma-70 factor (ECF subfamily)